MADKYDLIVLGAGPGGYVAAIRAAQLGLRAAVAENRQVGGTCLNRGCIPTKTLMHTAHLLRELKSCEKIGLRAEGVAFDYAAMHARKDEVISQLRGGIEGLLKANKIDLLSGAGTIAAPGKVLVDGTPYEAEKILIATGSVPARPPIPGIDLPGVVTSDELLTESTFYQRLAIIGGGVIGMEFATIYNALGCDVTVIEAMPRILPTMDKEISQNLAMILKKRGVKIFTGAMVEKVEGDGSLTVLFTAKDKAETVQADGVLVSIGRRANTSCAEGVDLGLERGMVPVNGSFETRVPGIYAIGDVVKGGIQLAHVASAQGVNAACAMCGKEPEADLSVVPSCIYTDPEIASAGITADEAAAAGIPVKTGKALMTANGKTMITMGERGFIKLVFHGETEKLLGAQLMCERATDMIGELATAIRNGLTLGQLAAVIRPHPTFNEAVTEAVEAAQGRAIHVAPKK